MPEIPAFPVCKTCRSALEVCTCQPRDKRPSAAVFLDELPEPAAQAMREAMGVELNEERP